MTDKPSTTDTFREAKGTKKYLMASRPNWVPDTVMSLDEFKREHSDMYRELQEFLDEFKSDEYGYESGDEEGDVSLNPEADPQSNWFWVNEATGYGFWKWIHDPFSHGQAFYVPDRGWVDPEEGGEVGELWNELPED